MKHALRTITGATRQREAIRHAARLGTGVALLLGSSGACVKPPADPTRSPQAAEPAAGSERLAGASAPKIPQQTPLSQIPFLMAHDAATTYRADYYLPAGILASQVQTQPAGGFSALLDCGVRAFDLRPCYTSGGHLYMHHGPAIIKRPLEHALGEIVDWAGLHPEALVLLYVSHCGSGGICAGGTERPDAECDAATAGVLAKIGLATLESVDISYGEALAKGRLANGGLVLAFRQARENYDASIQYCEGFKKKKTAFVDLFAYMDRVTAEAPSGAELVIAQAHWQDPYTTLIDGCAETVMEMEVTSELNRALVEKINSGQWPHLNLVEVDNACDHGLELKAALERQLAQQLAKESKAGLLAIR